MKNKTVIVLGISCSGTSIIAGLLHNMGVNMNPANNKTTDYPYGSFEDPEIQNLTSLMTDENREKIFTKKELLRMMKDLIKKRSKENEIWGWKSTLTHKCIDNFMNYIKNPYFIIIFRNILSNAESLKKQFATNYGRNIDFLEVIEMILKEQNILIDVLKKYESISKLFFQYEEIKDKIFQICIELSNFLEINPDYDSFVKLSKLYIDKKDIADKTLFAKAACSICI